MTEAKRQLGTVLIEALGRRESSQVRDLFHPQIRFRALVPPGLRAAEDANGAVEHLARWFDASDRFHVLASAVGRVGTREGVSYRIRLREEGAWYTVEQIALLDAKEKRIGSIDLLCSGFIGEPDGIEGPTS